MTIEFLLPLVAAFATLAFILLVVAFARRRDAPTDAGAPAHRAFTSDETADGVAGVPFTYLGVDVEPPCAPDWSSRAAAPKARAPRQHAPLALAHIDRATSILHDHLRREPASIAPWLMLLELYRTHGREQALGELARDFAERFHAKRDGANALRGGADDGLQAFPPVMRLVTMLWGTRECRDLLARLLRDRSEGRRLGLSRAAYVDIATLAALLETLLAEIEADGAEEAKVRAGWQTAAYVAQVHAA
jgi:hypothetical protein